MRARDDDLRALRRLEDFEQHHLQALAGAVVLRAHLLRRRQHGLRLAEVDDDVAAFEALDDAGDDVAFLAGVLLVHDLALGFAQALQHDLLRRLRGDAAGVRGRRLELQHVAELRVRLAPARASSTRHLDVLVLDLLDDGHRREDVDAAVLLVDLARATLDCARLSFL